MSSRRAGVFFTLAEFHCSDGTPVPKAAHGELVKLVAAYLDPLRRRFGTTVITSGFRTLRVNQLVGGGAGKLSPLRLEAGTWRRCRLLLCVGYGRGVGGLSRPPRRRRPRHLPGVRPRGQPARPCALARLVRDALLTAAGATLVAVLNELRASIRARQADRDRRELASALLSGDANTRS
jgi:hypothetical protein